jgi:membrane protein required for beta-lactamase induction
MGPREFFGKHPRLYWLALAGPILTAGYSLVAMRRAGDTLQARRYAALLAVSAVEALGLARIRPSGDGRPRIGSRWPAP